MKNTNVTDTNEGLLGVQTTMFGVEPTYHWIKKRSDNANQKHVAVRERFQELYNQKRLRIDDVVGMLCKEFFLAKITIERILSKGK